jgi:hypothetical protein
MNSSSDTIPETNAVYRERLQQAVRVMQGVVERHEEGRFDINVYAKADEGGAICCIAGFCGLDPWFQERGFITKVGTVFGDVGKSSSARTNLSMREGTARRATQSRPTMPSQP